MGKGRRQRRGEERGGGGGGGGDLIKDIIEILFIFLS